MITALPSYIAGWDNMRCRYPRYWDKTITIYHRKESKDEKGRTHIEWQRNIYENCFAHKVTKQTVSNNEIVRSSVNIVRIPRFTEVSVNDIVVLSDTSNDEVLTSELAIKNKYLNCFIASDIHDNTGMFLSHTYISE